MQHAAPWRGPPAPQDLTQLAMAMTGSRSMDELQRVMGDPRKIRRLGMDLKGIKVGAAGEGGGRGAWQLGGALGDRAGRAGLQVHLDPQHCAAAPDVAARCIARGFICFHAPRAVCNGVVCLIAGACMGAAAQVHG